MHMAQEVLMPCLICPRDIPYDCSRNAQWPGTPSIITIIQARPLKSFSSAHGMAKSVCEGTGVLASHDAHMPCWTVRNKRGGRGAGGHPNNDQLCGHHFQGRHLHALAGAAGQTRVPGLRGAPVRLHRRLHAALCCGSGEAPFLP